jgi:hypothetical protein
MGFLVNGIALDQPTLKWVVSEKSKVMPAVARRLVSLTRPGRSGVVRVPADWDVGTFTLVVNSPRANVESLAALLAAPDAILTDSNRSGVQALLDLVNLDYPRLAPSDRVVAVTAVYRLTETFWRATSDTTAASVSLSGGSGSIVPWAGQSAPVEDALILVHGPATVVTVTDHTTGFGFQWTGSLDSTHSLVYDMDAQEARVTSGSSFTGGTDSTSGLAMIGDRMRLYPILDSGTLVPAGKVDVVLTGAGGASAVQVKGRAAYAV